MIKNDEDYLIRRTYTNYGGSEMNIKNKLIEAYIKYRQNVLDNYERVSHLNVVIIMHPKTMAKLSAEEREIFRINIPDENINFIELCGRKTPVILDYTLPDDIEFTIKSQKDYEREEIEKMYKKFNKIFEE